MSDELRDLITWTIATILGVSAVLGLAVRWVLMPYLREHLIAPVKATARQVNVNGHTSDPPTLLDKVDKIEVNQRVMSQMWEGHLAWSEDETSRLWHEIRHLRGLIQ